MSVLLPWHKNIWETSFAAFQTQRLSHAYLLSGTAGLGQFEFANYFAQFVLCAAPDKREACLQCHSCRLFSTKAHPDCLMIHPEKINGKITVDQIRQLSHAVAETTLLTGYRVVIIDPVASMNTNAANALLKTLEEPVPKTLFLLVSDLCSQLPQTITSRCQKIVFTKPKTADALLWLEKEMPRPQAQLLLNIAEGAPLKALALAGEPYVQSRKKVYEAIQAPSFNPLALAASLQTEESETVLQLLVQYLSDVLRLILTSTTETVMNMDYQDSLISLSKTLSASQVIVLLDKLSQVKRQVSSGIHLNKQLLLEDIFIEWSSYVSS
jgi:DNA polymerase-3 subunit delta'